MEKFASKSAITKIQAVIIAVIVIIAAVAGVVYYLFSQAPVQAPEYIKIGFPTALSGIIGVFGEPVNWVVGMAEDIVNKDGGIYIADYGKKIPIKVIVRDCESDPDLAASLAAELITKDKVDFMIAYTTPMISVPVTAKCEQYSVPSVGWNLPMAMTEGGPYVWSFDSCWTELENVLAYIEVWNSLGSKTNKRVAIIGDNTADGQMWCPLIKTVSERKGYTVVDYSIAPVGTMDWTPYVLKWKDENVTILTGNMNPPDFISLWRQCDELGFVPPVVTIGRACCFIDTIEALGDIAVGVTAELWVHPGCPFRSSLTGQTVAEFAEAFEQEFNKYWRVTAMEVLQLFEITVDALKRAASLNKDKIRNALAETDLDTIVGHVNFKKTINETSTAEELELYEETCPEIFQMDDNFALLPSYTGQWVKGTKWPYEIELVCNYKYNNVPETAEAKTLQELQGS